MYPDRGTWYFLFTAADAGFRSIEMEVKVKRANKAGASIVSPDVEVTVRASGVELAAIAFYASDGGVWDVLVGVAHPHQRENIASVLRWSGDAVESAAFAITGYEPDENGRKGAERFDELPF